MAERLGRVDAGIKAAGEVVEPMLEHLIRFQHVVDVVVIPSHPVGNLFQNVADSRRQSFPFKLSHQLHILGSYRRIGRIPAVVFMAFNRAQPIERGFFSTMWAVITHPFSH